MQQIAQVGAFTSETAGIINSNFGAVAGVDVYVDPQNGTPGNNGLSIGSPFASMSDLDGLLEPGIRIGLFGVLKQCWAPRCVNDVTIIGLANQPRQATDSGVPNGGGATWLNPGTTASPLLNVGNASAAVSQAWRLQNIFFNNAGDAPCVKLNRSLAGKDASHAAFYGCKFTGADAGIQSVEASFVNIIGCEFYNFVGSTDCAVESIAGEGVALPLQWVIQGNRFWNNYAHLVAPLSSADVFMNMFGYIGSSITTTVQVHLDGGGKNNTVHLNRFQMAEATGTATMFGGGTNDSWLNYYTDALTTGVPS